MDFNPIKIDGNSYSKGIGTHANSHILYHLNGEYTLFTAMVGIDDEINNTAASVRFKVVGDGKDLFISDQLTATSTSQAVSLDIAGVDELELIVTDNEDGINSDHADWADIKVYYHLLH